MKRIFWLALPLMGLFLPAQAQIWNYENVLDDRKEGGQTPELLVDNAGTLHALWHNKHADRLVYAQRAAGSAQWQTEIVEPGRDGGYEPTMVLDGTGTLHVAYFGNLNGLQPRYATRNAAGDWVVEDITSYHVGTYGDFGLVDPVRIQASIDLLITDNGEVQVYFFNGYFEGCSNQDSVQLEPYRALRTQNGWVVQPFGNRQNEPIFLGFAACESQYNGARYGEFMNAFQRSDGRFLALATNRTNGRLAVYEEFPATINPVFWPERTIDYNDDVHKGDITDPTTELQQDFIPKMTFEGVSGQMVNDTLYISYAMSDNYGRNEALNDNNSDIKVSNILTVNFARVLPNLTVDTLTFIGPNNDDPVATYRTYTDIQVLNSDTIFVSIAGVNEDNYELATTYDGGLSWTREFLPLSNVTKMQAPLQIVDDTLQMLAYDNGVQTLYHYRKHVADGPTSFVRSVVARNTELGYRFDAGLAQNAGEDVLHMAFDDWNSRVLYYGQKANGSWSYDTLLNNLRTDELALSVQNDARAIAYRNGDSLRTLTHNGNGWQSGSLNNNINAGFLQLAHSPSGDTLHAIYLDYAFSQLIYRQGDGQNWWVNEVLNPADTGTFSGEFPALHVDDSNTPHVVYSSQRLDLQNATTYYILYARRNGNNAWAKDTVKSDSTILQLLQTAITEDSLGQPVVVVAGLRANSAPSLRSYQWRGDTIWHEQIVQTPFPGASLSPIVLTNDSIGRPWLLYTREALVNEPQIMHLGVESESWHDLYVDNNLPNGRIQNRADLLISGHRLYVIGAETASTNSGIGLLTLPDWTTVVDSFVSARPNLLANQNRLHVYPNPASDHVTLELEQAVAFADVELINLKGQRVANWQWQTESRDQRSAQLQLPDLPAGVYSLVFRGKATRFALKLIVQ